MPQDNQAPEMPANTTSVCGTDGNWLNLLDVFVPLFLFNLFLLFKAYGQFSDLSHHLDHTLCDLRTLAVDPAKQDGVVYKIPASVTKSILERREDPCMKTRHHHGSWISEKRLTKFYILVCCTNCQSVVLVALH